MRNLKQKLQTIVLKSLNTAPDYILKDADFFVLSLDGLKFHKLNFS